MLVARDDEVNAGLPGDVLCRDGDSGAVLMAGIWRSYHDSISFSLVNHGNSLGLPYYVASLQGMTLKKWLTSEKIVSRISSNVTCAPGGPGFRTEGCGFAKAKNGSGQRI